MAAENDPEQVTPWTAVRESPKAYRRTALGVTLVTLRYTSVGWNGSWTPESAHALLVLLPSTEVGRSSVSSTHAFPHQEYSLKSILA